MLRLLFHPTGMCKTPGQGVLVGLAKSLEKLSSGFRINRAADDAAGLAISEGLRSQVRGNRQAVRNAQDGISVIQTAEGALNEVHSILQRMRTLAVQGANDSNSPEARNNVHTELVQLRDELQRIGHVTNFNGRKLLDGTASGNNALNFQVGANGTVDDRIKVDLKDADVTAISQFSGEKKATLATKITNKTAFAVSTVDGKPNVYALDLGGKTINFSLAKGETLNKGLVEAKITAALKESSIDGFVYTGANNIVSGAIDDGKFKAAALAGKHFNLTIGDTTVQADMSEVEKKHPGATAAHIADVLNEKLAENKLDYKIGYDEANKTFKVTAGKDATKRVAVTLTTDAEGIQVGAAANQKTLLSGALGSTGGSGYKLEVDADGTKVSISRADGGKLDEARAHSITLLGKTPGTGDTDLGWDIEGKEENKTVTYNDLDVSSHDAAQNLIKVLDRKIQSVSTARANLGAIQNRFEHTITNLNVAVENLAASESRIRDTDMAQEMMQFTRNQILSQAGTSMLAQANQVPQGVLSLLR
ncbi:flagellin [Mobiluncus mulieris]|uniref:flagellin N-terminal helical domain-containing protein n=1 Tax=Mobiluncus mulieris TaxID=2052 RepID=UPI0024B35794|nr:flagellin [Mobiluncus mulieris]